VRTLFIFLALANLGLLAYATLVRTESRDAHLLAQQINPEKVRLLTPREVAQLVVIKRAEPPPPPPPPPKMLACIEWGSFVPADVARVEEALAPLALGAKLRQRIVEESAGFWVFIPPLANRRSVNQKAGELKRLGVEEYFIVQEDPKYRLAISLGIFKSEEAAKNRLEQLRKKGVRSAQVGARETLLPKVFFQVRDAPETIAAKLNEMKSAFSGSEVKNCPGVEAKAAS
jgi:SPOR domain